MAENIQELVEALLVLAQKLGQPNSSNEEQRMETFSNSMDKFHYDPLSGQTFEAWYRRYEEIFIEDAKHLDDQAKIRLCLRKLDAVSHDKFKDILLPSVPKDFTFDQIIGKLKKTFGRQESLFNSRYKCLQTVKDASTDFVTYASIINRRCEDSKIKEMSNDQFKCLMFVCGLQSSQDADIRTRLLSKLDGEEGKDITLDKLVTETQHIISLKRDTAIIGNASKSHPVVNAMQHSSHTPHLKVKQNKNGNPKRNTSNNKSSTPKRPCWLCGGVHFVRDCQFTSHKCTQCRNIGHKEGYCHLNKPKTLASSKQTQNKPRANVLRVKGITNEKNHGGIDSRRKYIQVEINGTSVKLQIDTASDLTIISEQTWTALGSPGTTFSPTGIKSASQDNVPIIAEFDCEMGILHIGQVFFGKCLVTNITDLNVLGIDWIERFGIWDRPINSICNVMQMSKDDRDSFISKLQNDYNTVFSDTPGLCTKVKAAVHLKLNARPVYRPKRPVSFAVLESVEQELDRLQELKIISPIDYSEWAAPIVAVKRPNGRIRICADYSTGLNSCIETNAYPLPTPDDMFSQLAGSKVFSKVDLSDAYLQIEVDEQSKRLLCINTHKGLFTFNRLAPGIKSAPGSFQQIVNSMLAGLNGTLAYFDDILIYSRDENTHKDLLRQLFQRLEEYGFRVKMEKCDFFNSQVKYLGMIVTQEGITTDPSKITAITSMPPPEDVPQLRSFLGAITFYGKFVKNMHELRAPLDRLLNADVNWNWSSACQQAFEKFKAILSSDLLLTHYNPALPVKVYSDACNTGVGASISHVYPDGTEKMIYHASRTLTKAEKNYSQIEKEGLALIFATKKFHRFIYGRRFTLVTDHKPLLTIFGSKSGIPVYTANRLQRWALALATYDFDIQYISTNDIGSADVLSRLIASSRVIDEEYVIASIRLDEEIYDQIEETIDVLPIDRKMIESATKNSKTFNTIVKFIQTDWPKSKDLLPNDDELVKFYDRRTSLSFAHGCIMFGDRIVIPPRYRKLVLRQLHQSHLGSDAMKMLARSHIYWPKIDEAISNLARSCGRCAENAKTPFKTLLRSWPRALRPMERLHTDIAGPVDGKWYLLSVDSHSMYPDVHECDNITSKTCIEKLSEFYAHHGNPETLVTDNGTQFDSHLFAEFCRRRGIVHIKTPPYHPMSNGRAERFVDTMKTALKKAKGEGTNKEILTKFLHAYRSTPNRRALQAKSPAELFLGRTIRMELDLLKPSPEHISDRDVQQEVQFNKHHGAQKRHFVTGDLVYAKIYHRNDWSWEPGVVTKRIGRVIYLIQLINVNRSIRSSANQMKQRYTNDTNSDCSHLPFDLLIPTSSAEPPDMDSSFETASSHSFNIADDSDSMDTQQNVTSSQSSASPSTSARPVRRHPRYRRIPTHLQDYVLN